MLTPFTLPAVSILVALGSLLPTAQQVQRRDLSGRWELQRRPGPPTGGSSGQTTPPDGQRQGRGRNDAFEKERRQAGLLLGMSQSVPAFSVKQDDSTLVVTNDDGFTYTLYLDGRKSRLNVSDSVQVEYRARWTRDGDLVVEWKPDGGGKMTESYAPAVSSGFLRLDVTVEHKFLGQPVWQSRLYRRVEGGS